MTINVGELLSGDDAITPSGIAAYLQTTGWALTQGTAAYQQWALFDRGDDAEPSASLMLPLDRTYRDFSRRYQEALSLLTDVNDWSIEQLAMNVLGVRSDLLYIRADQATHDGSIPLREAERLISGSVQMLTAAAQATISPKPSFAGRRAAQADEFIRDDVRMGHTRRGSFIITVLARLDEAQEIPRTKRMIADDEPDTLVIPSFQRRVMGTLARAVQSVQRSASAASKNASIDIERAVAQGVSTNLCESLSTMTSFEGLRNLDLSFQWAKVEESAIPDISQVVIARDEIAELPKLTERLRIKPTATFGTVFGQVTRLERAEGEDEGVVTVTGVVGRSTRRTVHLYLTGKNYNDAIRAHRRRLTVIVTGTVAREGNGYWLREMREFEVGRDRMPN